MVAAHQLLSLGFSPCPNDTFIFHALVTGGIKTGAIAFAPPMLADVETLNHWAMQGRLDVSKVSMHALGHLLDNYVLLGSGAALGRGCGPLLVAARPLSSADLHNLRVAIPGQYTTAALLLRLYASRIGATVAMPFHRIMEAVTSGEVDAGVIIHEGRFTYQRHGLCLIQDLGVWWEEETGHPIPLGGIVGRRSLGPEVLRQVEDAIRASVRAAFAQSTASRAYVKCHAQELEDEVVAAHIKLYVNHFSEDLGPAGRAAITEFLHRGHAAGLFAAPPGTGVFLAKGL